MADVTFIVPVAPYHEALLGRTLASIDAQSVPAEVVVIRDDNLRGAGWARNQGIAQVTTPFLTFLDADDEVLPEFAQILTAAYQPRRFIYTDWLDEDVPYHAPKCPWIANTRNAITCLLRTEDVRAVGGFDETLDGLEDTQLFLKLLSSGICGLHVPVPLFRYHKDGRRSAAFYQTPAYHAAVQRFNAEFGSKPMTECGGCGGSPYGTPEIENLPIGEAQPGDVLAQALWAGNRQERGRMTGRLYPRASNGKHLWLDARDIDAAPHLFSRVLETPKASPVPARTDGFQAFAAYAMQTMLGGTKSAPEVAPAVYGAPGIVKPDVGNLLRLYANSH